MRGKERNEWGNCVRTQVCSPIQWHARRRSDATRFAGTHTNERPQNDGRRGNATRDATRRDQMKRNEGIGSEKENETKGGRYEDENEGNESERKRKGKQKENRTKAEGEGKRRGKTNEERK